MTLLGSGAGRQAAGLAAGCPGEPAPCSPAQPPATVPGGLCPRCCRCCARASSCSPARPWRRSLFARHYFYQNFREVPVRSSPGIYLGPLMSRQRWPCQALPAGEDKRALPPHGDHSSPPAGLGTAGQLSSWGLPALAQAGGARRCTVGPMAVGQQSQGGGQARGGCEMGGDAGAAAPAKGPGDASGEGASRILPFRNRSVPSLAPAFSLPQPVPKLWASGEQPTET